MKIVFLARSLDPGGAERQLVALAKGLHARGHEVSVLVFYAGGPLEQDLREAGVPVRGLGKRGRWDVARFAFGLVRELRRTRPDVVHGYLPVPNVMAVLARPFLRDTAVVWGVRASFMDLGRYDRVSRASYAVEVRLAPYADLIIANSHAGRAHALARGFPSARTIVVPNGVDVARFRRDRAAGQRLRADWGVKRDESLVGLVGRLDPMKDHPTFLRAAALLARRRPGVRFLCAGAGPAEYGARLRQTARDLGIADRVIWAGGRTDMPAVYNALDVLCSASYGEGFSNAIAEAMACGVSCVVTDVGDSAELLGDAGQIVPPRDAKALADALGTMLDRAREDPGLADRVRARITQHFSLEALAASTEAALATALSPGKARSAGGSVNVGARPHHPSRR